MPCWQFFRMNQISRKRLLGHFKPPSLTIFTLKKKSISCSFSITRALHFCRASEKHPNENGLRACTDRVAFRLKVHWPKRNEIIEIEKKCFPFLPSYQITRFDLSINWMPILRTLSHWNVWKKAETTSVDAPMFWYVWLFILQKAVSINQKWKKMANE